ncbi:MAG: hypothetical protein IID41_13315 [Planctomycetes bacterium]|nr:hypothetical protein [Planctomycetota bacterium]
MAKRRSLPSTRRGKTHSVIIHDVQGDMTIHIRVGFYDRPRGKVGEVFIGVGKAGSTMNGFCDVLGRLISYALQYGVPLAELAPKLTGHQFPPAGQTSNPAIPQCSSLVDYVFTWLDLEFGNGPTAAEKTETAA